MKLPHRPTKKRRKSRSTRFASSDLKTGVATTSDETNSPATSSAEDETNIVDSAMQVSNPCMRREIRPVRFRLYHAEQWSEKLNDLKDFISEYGHAMVPHNYAPDPELSRWAKVCVSLLREQSVVYYEYAHISIAYSFALMTSLLFLKRQRYQYKLYQQQGPGMTRQKRSSLTPQRIEALNNVGFCWDAHVAIWTERYEELVAYKDRYGNTNVPSNYKGDAQEKLATWVKCQRRQYTLRKAGAVHNITDDRVALLEKIGFEWSLGNPCKKAVPQGGVEANDKKEVHPPHHPAPVMYKSSGSFDQRNTHDDEPQETWAWCTYKRDERP
jgi:Helicase associated domain